ncbi:MAG: hypothetical protein ACI4MR_05280, partial [Candidatus Aphodomorpha sp.]
LLLSLPEKEDEKPECRPFFRCVCQKHAARQRLARMAKAPASAGAFVWDGMGGNIGGSSLWFSALVLRYTTVLS